MTNQFFSRNEANATHRDVCDLKGLDYRGYFVIVYVDSAVVQPSQQPLLLGMEVDGVDSARVLEQFSLQGMLSCGSETT